MLERIGRRQVLAAGGILFANFLLPEVLQIETRIKTPEELQVESIIETGFSEYFRYLTIAGKTMRIRIPFGEWGERFSGQNVYKGGKGEPQNIWGEIEKSLLTLQFSSYCTDLSKPREKLVVFDVKKKEYQIITDEKKIQQTIAALQGSKLFPYEHKPDGDITEIDIYNFLYCCQGLGIDCSGFVFYIQKQIAKKFGIVDLRKEICDYFKQPNLVIGTWYYAQHGLKVADNIQNLRAGDIILLPDNNRPVVHSMVIQSVDPTGGVIRYLQCTDWVTPRKERGPHSATIEFSPFLPNLSLCDPALTWTKKLGADFEGTPCPYGERSDNFRYCSLKYKGRVVRLPQIAKAFSKYY